MTDVVSVQRGVDRAIEDLGEIDVVINNAGLGRWAFRRPRPTEAVSVAWGAVARVGGAASARSADGGEQRGGSTLNGDWRPREAGA